MKKSFLQTTSLALAALALNSTLASATQRTWSGRYEGTGHWKDSQGRSGTYQAETVVTDSAGRPGIAFKTIYNYPLPSGNHEESAEFSVVETSKDFFNIESSPGEVIGQGYCVFSQCHYAYEMLGVGSPVKIEETINFYQHKLYKLGSKESGGKKTTWMETLEKKTELSR